MRVAYPELLKTFVRKQARKAMEAVASAAPSSQAICSKYILMWKETPMTSLSRRLFLQNASASAIALAIPAVAEGQILQIIELILKVLGGVSAALNIVTYLQKWFGDKKCAIPLDRLEITRVQCEILSDAVDNEGGGGAQRALQTFIERQDAGSWRRAKFALEKLLHESASFVFVLSEILKNLDDKAYPGSRDDLEKLNEALRLAREAIARLASSPDEPSPEALKLASEALAALKGLPEKINISLTDLQAIIFARIHEC